MRTNGLGTLFRGLQVFGASLALAALAAAPAWAGVGGAAGPTWPAVLAVGDPVSAYIDIVNASDGVNASENVDILLITFTPSCSAASVGQCTAPDPGVFNLTSVAIGDPQSACKNTFFTLVGPSPGGVFTLSPNQPIHLGPADGSGGLANPRNCRIVLAGSVTKFPVDSTPPNPPITTIQFARAILRGAVSQSVGAAVGQATVAITSIADLVIAKTDGQASVQAGGSTTYTVTVTNNGPSPADGAIVKDPAVAGLSKTAAACTGTTGGAVCPASTTTALLEGAGVVIPTLPKNGTVTFTVTATVSAGSGTVKNSASVTPPSGTTNSGTSCTTLPDPNSRDFSGGVCTAGDQNSVGLVTDLVIAKTDGVSSVDANGSTTYTVTVTNNGPSPADGAIVTDPLAAGLNKTAAACTGTTGGAVCPVSTTTALLEAAGVVIPTFPSGATVTFTVTATVTAASGTVKNLASVAPPAGATNPGTTCTTLPDPNSRSFSGGICTAGDLDNVGLVADLLIAKTNNASAVNASGSTTYTVTVTNNGPSAADGAIVKDPVATGLNKTAAACTGTTGGAACPGSTTTALLEGAGVVIPTFPSGATVTFTVTATVTATSGTVKNLASVTPPAGSVNPGTSCTTQPDPNSRSFAANVCTAGDLDDVTPVSTLTASKTDGATTYLPGGQTVYTIVVGNTGPSDAIGAVVTDAKPSLVTTWTWVCGAPTGGATGCDGAASGSSDFSDTVNLPVGSTITYTVTAQIAAGATGNLVNSVTVTPPGAGTPATATDTDTPAPVSDLTASKTDGATQYTPGGQTVYTIVVGNTGPSDAIGAVVTDPKPSQVTTWTWVCGAPTGGATGCDGAASGSSNFSDTVNLPVGSTITYTVTAQIAAGATGNLVNTVTVTPPAGGTPGTATDTDTPAAVVNGMIAHTATTCSEYVNNTPGIVLDTIFYSGTVTIGQNVNPGVFFYFATITTTVPNQVVTVTQSHTGTVANFVSTGQDKLFTANCASSIDGTDTPGGFGATWTVPTPGTYIVQIKYDSKSIAGTPVPVPDTVTYTFTTSGEPQTNGSVVLSK
jgi:uncharacterized repeat protein (TIGR01451 family)